MAFVNDEQLWVALGRELRDLRERKWPNPIDVQRAGGGTPNYAVVQQHERGQLKTFAMLAAHTKALGISVADLLTSVLGPILNKPISPEAANLLRQFEQMSVKDRHLLVATAERLSSEPQTPPSDPGSNPGHPKRAPRKK